MAVPVIMPRQGQSVESCIITKWGKQVGDKVAMGDILFSYETDKAAFDEESKVEGTLLAVFFEEGDDVPCLENVCVIGKPGANADAYRPGAEPPVAAEAPAAAAAPAAEIPSVFHFQPAVRLSAPPDFAAVPQSSGDYRRNTLPGPWEPQSSRSPPPKSGF